nr:PREDICTED: N-acetyl-beta-glucosaminyl-glycoprotein 4-beta-N-acetylgalactosaminyltransferase 1-like [Latimeria chalumnae]|eukprot:XP_014343912.1 PREDICTED: N-acetyl-beta-glucosaminyl-glycoprotein 4-beta-N-acetylgalactosaminyltransferase 1-like [Latimeria chalumnae]
MLWLPVKKIRKQFKLLLLLALLTFAIWFTYFHINLTRQGKALRLHFNYGRDGERVNEAGETSRRDVKSHTTFLQRKKEEASDSREDEQMNGEVGRSEGFSEEEYGGWHPKESERALNLTQSSPPWKPEFKGRANLHVFEDWCGSSINQLRKDIHFPLFPHVSSGLPVTDSERVGVCVGESYWAAGESDTVGCGCWNDPRRESMHCLA